MTKKDLVTKVFFNILKIWGCSWLAYGIAIIPSYLFSAINGTETPEARLLNNVLLAVVAGLVCCAFLFLFSYREAYKEAHIPQSRWFVILGATLSAVLYVLICVIFNSPYLAVQQIQLGSCMIDSQENFTRGTMLLSSLVLCPFWGGSLYFGACVGRRKRAKDREELLQKQNQSE